MVENVREALRIAEMPEQMIVYQTINLPALERLLQEDVLNFFNEVKTMTIFHLSNLGFSNGEISRRLGGNSEVTVSKILKEYKPAVTNSETQ